jgi:hypothetical protein
MIPMKKQTLFLLSLLSTFAVSAQEVVSTQGGSYSNVSANIDFTIGEIVINTGSSGSIELTQGFHQTNWNFVGLQNHSPSFNATIFPNPTSEILTIKTNTFENVNYSLYDAQGKCVIQDKLSSAQTPIRVGHLASGAYSLILKNDTQNLKTFQLVKQQ